MLDSRGAIRDATWSAKVHDLHADFCIYAVPVSVNPWWVCLAPDLLFVCKPNIALNSSHGNRLGKT
jgi:hypothetical protein